MTDTMHSKLRKRWTVQLPPAPTSSDENDTGALTTPWIEKDYLKPAHNSKRRTERALLEERYSKWQNDHKEEAAQFQSCLAELPGNIIRDEIDRRIALERKVRDIPTELLSFELERRAYETSNNPHIWDEANELL